MYHWIEDKEFLRNMRRTCSNLVNELVQLINNEDYLTVEAHLVGSGARNLETQNENEPIDLDYNLNILEIDGDINDCKKIKEYVKKSFDGILNKHELGYCKDSLSVLTTNYIFFKSGNKTRFSIDLAIVSEDADGSWYRLIHQKTGNFDLDAWIWNQGPNSQGLAEKVETLKEYKLWNEVRNTYLDKKNFYLQRNDSSHSSFICYIEAVNEIYNQNIE